MSAVQVQHFLERAQDFFKGMQLLREDEAYYNSSALLGIHAAVSYSDALRTGLGEEVLVAEDHQTAARALRILLSTRGQELEGGVRHLQALVAKKNAVAYGKRRLAANDYQLIFTQAERFAKWANSIGDQLRIEGWAYGNQ